MAIDGSDDGINNNTIRVDVSNLTPEQKEKAVNEAIKKGIQDKVNRALARTPIRGTVRINPSASLDKLKNINKFANSDGYPNMAKIPNHMTSPNNDSRRSLAPGEAPGANNNQMLMEDVERTHRGITDVDDVINTPRNNYRTMISDELPKKKEADDLVIRKPAMVGAGNLPHNNLPQRNNPLPNINRPSGLNEPSPAQDDEPIPATMDADEEMLPEEPDYEDETPEEEAEAPEEEAESPEEEAGEDKNDSESPDEESPDEETDGEETEEEPEGEEEEQPEVLDETPEDEEADMVDEEGNRVVPATMDVSGGRRKPGQRIRNAVASAGAGAAVGAGAAKGELSPTARGEGRPNRPAQATATAGKPGTTGPHNGMPNSSGGGGSKPPERPVQNSRRQIDKSGGGGEKGGIKKRFNKNKAGSTPRKVAKKPPINNNTGGRARSGSRMQDSDQESREKAKMENARITRQRRKRLLRILIRLIPFISFFVVMFFLLALLAIFVSSIIGDSDFVNEADLGNDTDIKEVITEAEKINEDDDTAYNYENIEKHFYV